MAKKTEVVPPFTRPGFGELNAGPDPGDWSYDPARDQTRKPTDYYDSASNSTILYYWDNKSGSWLFKLAVGNQTNTNTTNTNTNNNSGGGGGGGGAAVSTAYQSLAQSYINRSLSGGEVANLIQNQVSVAEFAQRLIAFNRIQQNKAVLDAFQDIVGKPLNFQQRLDFITGKGNPEYYRVYDKWATEAAGINAGFTMGGKGDLNLNSYNIAQLQKSLGAQGPQAGNLDQQLAKPFANLANLAINALPAGRRQGLGVTPEMLIEMIAGGPNAATYADTVNRALRNDAAFFSSQRARVTTAQAQRGEQLPPAGSY